MLKKLIFTSVIFLSLAGILATVAMRETARMGAWQAKKDAEMIEQGAIIYAQRCATCHGKYAKAEMCFAPDDLQIGCSGRSLNNPSLLCGDSSPRLQKVEWNGTREEYIRAITAAGNESQGMPAFGEAYRYDTSNALTDRQIGLVTAYILNYEDPHPCPPPTEMHQDHWIKTVADLPAGDSTAGEPLYNITYGCSACHGELNVEGSNIVGSWTGIFKDLDTRREGYTAADYVYESILLPSAHISPDCPTGPCLGPPSGMPDNYGLRMSVQEIADIMAYLNINTQNSNRIELSLQQD